MQSLWAIIIQPLWCYNIVPVGLLYSPCVAIIQPLRARMQSLWCYYTAPVGLEYKPCGFTMQHLLARLRTCGLVYKPCRVRMQIWLVIIQPLWVRMQPLWGYYAAPVGL